MKRSIIYKAFSVAALALAVFASFSCTEKEPEITVEPNFPAMVTKTDIVPGEMIKLSFVANLDWEISIPEQSYKWFKIMDGKFQKMSIKGKASNLRQSVTIWTTGESSFSLRSCKVNMKMGGKTQTVAEYMLQVTERVLEFYSVNMTEDGFEQDGDNYVYSDSQMTDDQTIELVWSQMERKYYYPILVKSNFNWEVQWPEWVRADIAEGASRVGELPLLVYGLDKSLPLDNSLDGKISFMSGDFMKEINVKIPSSKHIFEYNLSGYTELTYDHASYLHSGSGSYSKDAVQGYIYGPRASRTVVVDMVDGKYSTQAGSAWVKLTEGNWDDVEGAAVLQERKISVEVSRHIGSEERSALILALPATAPQQLSDLLTSDMTQVKDEYSSYAITVTQAGRPDEYITFEEQSAETMDLVGIIFEKASIELPTAPVFDFVEGCDQWQYNLSYVKDMAETKSAIYLTEAYATIEIYDAEWKSITENLSEHWLGYTSLGEGLYGQITMSADKLPTQEIVGTDGKTESKKVSEIDGYVVFKDYSGRVLSIVHCFYKAEKKMDEDVLEDASEAIFRDQELAAQANATAFKVVAGPIYERFKELQAPVYVLTYKSDDTTLDIKTNKNALVYSPYSLSNDGKAKYLSEGPKMLTVDNQIFYDKEFVKLVEAFNKQYPNPTIEERQQFEPKPEEYDRSTSGFLYYGTSALEPTRTYPGYSSINMKLPAGAVAPYREILQFADMNKTYIILICVLDI